MERIEMGIEELTKLEDFLSAVPSKQTRKNYRNGVKKLGVSRKTYRDFASWKWARKNH